jgi:hypothetical protein
MRLTDLDPKLTALTLRFDCPACSLAGKSHGIRIPVAGSHWTVSGEFPDSLTVLPSIDSGCWHGFITNGEVR